MRRLLVSAIAAFLLASWFLSAACADTDAQLNLIVNLGFDEGGGEVAHGTSAIINDGKVFGAVYVKGKSGSALRFEKDGDRVEIPDSPSLSGITTAMTLECRAYFDLEKLAGKSGTLISKTPLSGFGNGFYLFFSDTAGASKAIEFGTAQYWDTRQGCRADNAVTSSGWHHIIVAYDSLAADGKNTRIYVDGQLIGNYSMPLKFIAPNTLPLTIGASQVSWEQLGVWSNTFRGDIDEIKVWSKALSLEEINKLYGSNWAKSKPVAPANGAATSARPTFSWTKAGDGTDYVFELSTVPGFRARTTVRKRLTSTACTLTNPLRPGVWYWRVWSTEKSGRPTAACETRAVVVAWKDNFSSTDTTPPVITDVQPVVDEGELPARPSFSAVWSDDKALDLKSARLLIDGKDVTRDAAVTEEGITYTPSVDLADGMHKLAISIKDKAGNISNIIRQSFSITKPCKADIRVGKDRLLYINGEPWFPVIGYGGGVSWLEMARAGFNSMYGGLGPRADNEYILKDLRAAGLRYYADVCGYTGTPYYSNTPEQTYKSTVEVARHIDKLPEYFAVGLDEPNGNPVGLQYAREIWRATQDSGHGKPVIWVLNSPSAAGAYGEIGDGVAIDCYPVPTRPMDTVAKFIDYAHEMLDRKKPVWFIAQALDWQLEQSQYRPVPADKTVQQVLDELKKQGFVFRPSAREIRCMCYLALAHDIQGLMIYPNPSGGPYIGISYFPEPLRGMLDTASQVRWLSPVLLSTEPVKPVTVEPKDSGIHIATKSHGGATYLIAVNPTELPVSATFSLPGKAERVDSVFENRTLKPTGKSFSDLFKPGDARVYKIR